MVCRCELPASSVSFWEEVVRVDQVCQSIGYNSFQCFAQSIEEGRSDGMTLVVCNRLSQVSAGPL